MAPNEYIKLLAMDGIQPTLGSIKNREYPFTSEVYAVVRTASSPSSLEARLRDWLLTPAGQALVAESGYAAYSD